MHKIRKKRKVDERHNRGEGNKVTEVKARYGR
jgi:hypothetical protein